MARAQVFLVDAIVACVIFTIIFIAAAITWQYSRESVSIAETRGGMERIARESLSSLVSTRGDPYNWTRGTFNRTEVRSLGLSEGFQRINQSKLNAFLAFGYDEAKYILGIIGPGLEFSINITVWDGAAYQPNSTYGITPNSSAYEVVKYRRTCLIGNRWSRIEMLLWKSCEAAIC